MNKFLRTVAARPSGVGPLQLAGVTLAGIVAKNLTERAWSSATGRAPPEDPGRADVGVREAVAWTVAVGVAVGVARLVAGRVARHAADR
jgi:hypothetical protein